MPSWQHMSEHIPLSVCVMRLEYNGVVITLGNDAQ